MCNPQNDGGNGPVRIQKENAKGKSSPKDGVSQGYPSTTAANHPVAKGSATANDVIPEKEEFKIVKYITEKDLEPFCHEEFGKNARLLDGKVRRIIEGQLGLTFFRIHDDADAKKICKSKNANCCVYANHLFFADGKYAPSTPEGRILIGNALEVFFEHYPNFKAFAQEHEKELNETTRLEVLEVIPLIALSKEGKDQWDKAYSEAHGFDKFGLWCANLFGDSVEEKTGSIEKAVEPLTKAAVLDKTDIGSKTGKGENFANAFYVNFKQPYIPSKVEEANREIVRLLIIVPLARMINEADTPGFGWATREKVENEHRSTYTEYAQNVDDQVGALLPDCDYAKLRTQLRNIKKTSQAVVNTPISEDYDTWRERYVDMYNVLEDERKLAEKETRDGIEEGYGKEFGGIYHEIQNRILAGEIIAFVAETAVSIAVGGPLGGALKGVIGKGLAKAAFKNVAKEVAEKTVKEAAKDLFKKGGNLLIKGGKELSGEFIDGFVTAEIGQLGEIGTTVVSDLISGKPIDLSGQGDALLQNFVGSGVGAVTGVVSSKASDGIFKGIRKMRNKPETEGAWEKHFNADENFNEKITKAKEDFNEADRIAKENHKAKIGEAKREYESSELKAQRIYDESYRPAESIYKKNEAKIEKDFETRKSVIESKHDEKITKAKEDFSKASKDIEQTYNKKVKNADDACTSAKSRAVEKYEYIKTKYSKEASIKEASIEKKYKKIQKEVDKIKDPTKKQAIAQKINALKEEALEKARIKRDAAFEKASIEKNAALVQAEGKKNLAVQIADMKRENALVQAEGKKNLAVQIADIKRDNAIVQVEVKKNLDLKIESIPKEQAMTETNAEQRRDTAYQLAYNERSKAYRLAARERNIAYTLAEQERKKANFWPSFGRAIIEGPNWLGNTATVAVNRKFVFPETGFGKEYIFENKTSQSIKESLITPEALYGYDYGRAKLEELNLDLNPNQMSDEDTYDKKWEYPQYSSNDILERTSEFSKLNNNQMEAPDERDKVIKSLMDKLINKEIKEAVNMAAEEENAKIDKEIKEAENMAAEEENAKIDKEIKVAEQEAESNAWQQLMKHDLPEAEAKVNDQLKKDIEEAKKKEKTKKKKKEVEDRIKAEYPQRMGDALSHVFNDVWPSRREEAKANARDNIEKDRQKRIDEAKANARDNIEKDRQKRIDEAKANARDNIERFREARIDEAIRKALESKAEYDEAKASLGLK